MKLILYILFITLNCYSFDKYQLTAGLQYNIPEVKNTQKQNKPTGEFGLIARTSINSNLDFRTGLVIKRSFTFFETQSLTSEYTFDYVSLPLTIANNITETMTIIYGASVSALISNECVIKENQSLCDDFEPNSTIASIIIGAGERIDDDFEVEVYLESSVMELAKDINLTSISFNFLYNL